MALNSDCLRRLDRLVVRGTVARDAEVVSEHVGLVGRVESRPQVGIVVLGVVSCESVEAKLDRGR